MREQKETSIDYNLKFLGIKKERLYKNAKYQIIH